MPQYKAPFADAARQLDAGADAWYARGTGVGQTGDKFIRVTVILASVLFLLGISTHFPLRSVGIGLIVVGAGLIVFAGVQLLRLPGLPG